MRTPCLSPRTVLACNLTLKKGHTAKFFCPIRVWIDSESSGLNSSSVISSLPGFACRCGHQFCPLHRYADTHMCTFDYKTSGREELEKHHPKIVAAKIDRLWPSSSATTTHGCLGTLHASKTRVFTKAVSRLCVYVYVRILQPNHLIMY